MVTRMHEIYGLPQPLNGAELVTIYQMQNGQLAKCTMPLSDLVALIGAGSFAAWATDLQTTLPTEHGVPWNNNGVISIS